jgi:hypothetical protein
MAVEIRRAERLSTGARPNRPSPVSRYLFLGLKNEYSEAELDEALIRELEAFLWRQHVVKQSSYVVGQVRKLTHRNRRSDSEPKQAQSPGSSTFRTSATAADSLIIRSGRRHCPETGSRGGCTSGPV